MLLARQNLSQSRKELNVLINHFWLRREDGREKHMIGKEDD